MTPDFSVVVPTHGKRALLARTLAALRAQTYPAPRWNVVVVDDASPDDTAAWLAAEAPRWDGRLHVVSPERNVGRARARNLGAAAADGRWLLFLDDDVVAPPGLLSAHRELLGEDPRTGSIGRVVTDPALVDAPHFHYIDTRGVAKVRGGRVPGRYLVTQNTAVPRDAFRDVGGFDEGFLAYGFEDMDLGFRLEDHGVRFRPLQEPAPVHVHHHTLAEWLAKKRECGHGPLQRITANHPARLAEMRLHWVLDPPGVRPSPLLRLLRWGARTLAAPGLGALARRWPAGPAHRPRAAALHARLLDLLILSCYCQGVADHGSPHDSGS